MLVDVEMMETDALGQNSPVRRVTKGVYEARTFSLGRAFSFGELIAGFSRSYDSCYPKNLPPPFSLGEVMGINLSSAYGVCDSVEQFVERCAPPLDEIPDRLFVASLVVLPKDGQPSEGGWRWHKWGPYIGDHEPQHEYLYDEGPEITQVCCFHVYELTQERGWET